jgi:hypothetical protein
MSGGDTPNRKERRIGFAEIASLIFPFQAMVDTIS